MHLSDKPRWVRIGIFFGREIGLVLLLAVSVITVMNGLNRLHTPSGTPKATGTVHTRPVTLNAPASLARVDFGKSRMTLLLVTKPNCPYCVRSEPFHRRLVAESSKAGVPLYMLVPEEKAAASYTVAAGFSSSMIRSWEDFSLRVSGTPTLLAVDSLGHIRRVWIGLLGPSTEAEVLTILQTPALLLTDDAPVAVAETSFSGPSGGVVDGVRDFDLKTLALLRKSEAVQIVKIAERDPMYKPATGVILIPLSELAVRATFELDRDGLSVVDCSGYPKSQCEEPVRLLMFLGFRVATLHSAGLTEIR